MVELSDWLSGFDRLYMVLLLLPFILVGLVVWISTLLHRQSIVTTCNGMREAPKTPNRGRTIDLPRLVEGGDLRRIGGGHANPNAAG